MTGRELIVYILSHGMENENVIDSDSVLKMLDVNRMAVELGVGPECIKVWSTMGILNSIEVNDTLYFIIKSKE